MLVVAKRFVLASIIIILTKKIYATPRKNYFQSTFVTQKKNSDERPNPDSLEILERSSFHSEEDISNSSSEDSKSQKDNSKKLEHLYLPKSNEIFIEKNSGKSNDDEDDIDCQQPYYYPYYNPLYPGPYAPPYYYGSPFLYPPPHFLYPYYPHPSYCENQHRKRSNKKSGDIAQNIFQILNYMRHRNKRRKKRDLGESSRGTPHVYFYKNNKDGTMPSLKEIREQPVSYLTEERLEKIAELLQKPNTPLEDSDLENCTPRNIDKCKTSTISNTSTNTTCEYHNETLDKACFCGCKDVKDVILKKVIHSCTPCTEKPQNHSCNYLSDNLQFCNINLNEIEKCWNCTTCGCDSEEDICEKCHRRCTTNCKKKPLKDVDELFRIEGCPYDISQYPFNPYFNAYPWWCPRNEPYFPHTSSHHCADMHGRYFPYTGYFQPLTWFPPWFYSQSDDCKCKRTNKCT